MRGRSIDLMDGGVGEKWFELWDEEYTNKTNKPKRRFDSIDGIIVFFAVRSFVPLTEAERLESEATAASSAKAAGNGSKWAELRFQIGPDHGRSSKVVLLSGHL